MSIGSVGSSATCSATSTSQLEQTYARTQIDKTDKDALTLQIDSSKSVAQLVKEQAEQTAKVEKLATDGAVGRNINTTA